MALSWKRCAGYLAISLSTLTLVACGSSTVASALEPSRIISFGDGQSDIGQSGHEYTVSGTGDISNWTTQIALRYGTTLAPAIHGGTSYAVGNSRIIEHPDAAGNPHTPTLENQISTFLEHNQFHPDDLILVSEGTSDMIVTARRVMSGTITAEQAYAIATHDGQQLSNEIQRIIHGGGEHIVVIGAYNLGHSIWARVNGQQALLGDMSRRFNDSFKIAMQEAGYGNNVLYIDFEEFSNYVYNGPRFYGIEHNDQPVCDSRDPGPGIGIGTNEVNSALCNIHTLVNPQFNLYAFADDIYFTPTLQRQFGNWAYNQIRDRW